MSAGLTYLQYGNVALYRVVTQSVDQQLVTDDSDTDMIYMKTTIKVNGFLHGHTDWLWQFQLPTANGGNAALAHGGVRFQLPPRQVFALYVGVPETIPDGMGNQVENTSYAGGTPWIVANPFPVNMSPPPVSDGQVAINLQDIDVRNGPRCTSFVVTQVTANEVFAVEATFEICKVECQIDSSVPYNTYGVLSNRWSTFDVIDANNQTTRTYNGTVVFASANINAQLLRWIVAPPLQPLFRREHMDFKVTPDGLKLQYTITDREVATSAPWPARKMEISQTEHCDSALVAHSSMEVNLEGDSRVNKKRLIEIAFYIISNKIFGCSPSAIDPATNTYIIEAIEFTDYTGSVNRITARAMVRRQSNNMWNDVVGRFITLGTPLKATDLPPPNDGTQGGLGGTFVGGIYSDRGGNSQYDPTLSWGAYTGQIPAVQGPASVVGIFACFLQVPCDDNHKITVAGQTLPQKPLRIAQPAPLETPYTALVVNDIVTTSNPLYSTSENNCMYTFWRMEAVYKRNAMRVQMPIAATPSTLYTPTSAQIILCGGQERMVLRVSAERVGDWPEYPDLDNLPAWPTPSSPPSGYSPILLTGLKRTLKAKSTHKTVLAGQYLYSAVVEYIVALSRPPTPAEALLVGNDKWTNLGVQSTDSTLTNSSW